jgi:peptidoglycan/LPS O-acetylase OafA/YrhL
VMIGVTLLVDWLWKSPPATGAAVSELLFVQNYYPGLWAHTWSLAVEEHFYLGLALAIWLMARRGGANPFDALTRWIPRVCALILALRIATWIVYRAPADYIHLFATHLRVDSLLFGVLIAYHHTFQPQALESAVRRWNAWIAPLSIGLLAPIAFLDQSHPFIYTVGFSMVAAGFSLLLLMVLFPSNTTSANGTFRRGLAALGRVSYAFYLWHGPVLFAFDRASATSYGEFLRGSIIATMAVTFSTTLAVAYVTTALIERPLLRLRDVISPSSRLKSDPIVVAQPA